MMAAYDESAPLRGELRMDEPMAKHTTWRVGGPARRWYRPADADDLVEFLHTVPQREPVYWVGLGSNLLVRDGGFEGTVVATYRVFRDLTLQGTDLIHAGAGIACAKIARFGANHGLTGSEFLVGIPGTFGGALAMNAGAFGGATWELVVDVETMDRFGKRRVRRPEEFEIGYRSVKGARGEWFTGARLKLAGGDIEQSQARLKELLAQRGRTQPTQLPSCGSVFRNPAGDYAARLVESAGLKGRCVGGACVSGIHANFIVNTGAASAADIEALIAEVRQEVERQHGIRLELEVRIIGEQGLPAGGKIR